MREHELTLDNNNYYSINISHLVGASVFGYLNTLTLNNMSTDLLQNLIYLQGEDYKTTFILTEFFRSTTFIILLLLTSNLLFKNLKRTRDLFIILALLYPMLQAAQHVFYVFYFNDLVDRSIYTLRKYYNYINMNFSGYRIYLNIITHIVILILFSIRNNLIKQFKD